MNMIDIMATHWDVVTAIVYVALGYVLATIINMCKN